MRSVLELVLSVVDGLGLCSTVSSRGYAVHVQRDSERLLCVVHIGAGVVSVVPCGDGVGRAREIALVSEDGFCELLRVYLLGLLE